MVRGRLVPPHLVDVDVVAEPIDRLALRLGRRHLDLDAHDAPSRRGDPPTGACHPPSDAAGRCHLQCEALDCAGCGRANRDGARFCDGCGGPLTPVAPEVPRTVGDGRYEIGDRLGEGARKVVYRGTDSRLGRDVAVALIKTDGLDAHGRARVQREARAMARLGDHPHVVSVLDAGEEDGRPFIVSQLLTGGSLEERLADIGAALEVADAVRIGRQVAEGLASAHAQGVVHRDVKPANIWFDAAGNALLGDFGLAQVADEARLTTEGMIVGTASYLAPEVAVGRDADARSDLYSFGAVLYELLTGRPPFLGDLTEVVSQHVNTAPVDPAFHNPAVPSGLDALVRRLLAKDPDERPRDAADVVATLTSVALTPAPPAADPAPTPVPVDARFVGRGPQLEALRAALESALSGRAGLVLVAGEPGVGKTTLVEQVVSEAKVRGAGGPVGPELRGGDRGAVPGVRRVLPGPCPDPAPGRGPPGPGHHGPRDRHPGVGGPGEVRRHPDAAPPRRQRRAAPAVRGRGHLPADRGPPPPPRPRARRPALGGRADAAVAPVPGPEHRAGPHPGDRHLPGHGAGPHPPARRDHRRPPPG